MHRFDTERDRKFSVSTHHRDDQPCPLSARCRFFKTRFAAGMRHEFHWGRIGFTPHQRLNQPRDLIARPRILSSRFHLWRSPQHGRRHAGNRRRQVQDHITLISARNLDDRANRILGWVQAATDRWLPNPTWTVQHSFKHPFRCYHKGPHDRCVHFPTFASQRRLGSPALIQELLPLNTTPHLRYLLPLLARAHQ